MSVATTPRLRMFAGPNGSGKSTIKAYVSRFIDPKLFGYYINPDELEKAVKRFGFLDFTNFNLRVDRSEVLGFFQQSGWLNKLGLAADVARLDFSNNKLDFSRVAVNSYFASVASDLIRRRLLLSQQTFTIETVMSAPDKVEFLAEAQRAGFRTYLYYVATEDPAINISRVEIRVREGGHDVPADKITTRYYRSLDLLWEAIEYSSRAYVFDNSAAEAEWIAEITDAEEIELKTDNVPAWFVKYVLDKIDDGQ